MAILVTGGAGYIGSHTCVELLNEGFEIIIVDNFSNSKPESLKRVSEITGKWFKTYNIDLLNAEGLEQVFSENEIEAVIHFAGLKAVGESVMVPLTYYQNNLIGTVILCETMKKYGVKNLVFSSSATVYGSTAEVPIPEETPLEAVNPYGRSKQMIEEILQDLYFSDQSWSISLLRYFNPIGAHASGRIGEDPNGIPNNLLPYISQVAVGKLQLLNIFGNDYQTKDGTGIRDYIHVVDLAIGHLRALEKVQSTQGVEAYNLGTGRGYSVLEMVQAFESASGESIPYTVIGRRPGDAAVCFADVSKARDQLGWIAAKGIDEMCKDTWKWQQSNPNGYRKETEVLNESNSPVRKEAAGFLVSNK
ncbi:UDP-glucose 4-epimerase GalE [Peribacillus cavernae]|uniref:UDP-glucose 4-epimerase n=1 Tax=Peribacillus cavernae TaxID=1674310 RepID=A0A433HP10_9BACI|nr:UDP-glucose 4-epimerase GalE [Peribacillus cavernae]MDQ0217492.1 UDP-glucose 4-epimerase [Peribacillus cavernae]RUQ30067.1 UDP-glucose 4-epimerase GalE [Peribacillus cavernae]